MEPAITITYDPDAEQMTWRVDELDPMGAMGLMVDVLIDMQKKWIESPTRPILPNKARICLEMADDKVAFASSPETAQPLELQGMLVTALIGFIKRKQKPGFDPYEQFLGALLLEV